MTLREFILKNKIKQITLSKALGVDTCRISLHVNGIAPLPDKHQKPLAKLLGVTLTELKTMSGMKE